MPYQRLHGPRIQPYVGSPAPAPPAGRAHQTAATQNPGTCFCPRTPYTMSPYTMSPYTMSPYTMCFQDMNPVWQSQGLMVSVTFYIFLQQAYGIS